MNRSDFPILNNDFIYFDNGATSLKPKTVIDSMNEYYSLYTANSHRGDYDNSLKVDTIYEGVRDKVRDFIKANSSKEIVFTSGTTDSLNRIVFGFMKDYLKKDDEVLITIAEHASNTLPWFELEKELGIKVKYIPLDNHIVTVDNVLNSITDKTKVISLAHITNVLGDVRPISEIGKICRDKNIIFVVDGAQSVPHTSIDVNSSNIDFLAFSGHKMLGPTGIGVLYGKLDLLEKMKPLEYGGGMNDIYDTLGNVTYKELPTRLEAGTQNIAGVIGLGSAIDYLVNIGMDKINSYELELKEYFLDKIKDNPNIIIYNKDIKSGTVAFNIKDVFSQDTAIYLNHYKICVRAGNHCSKLLKEDIGVKNTCRISFYFYNTKEEIDKLVSVLSDTSKIFDVIL